jgi:serine/threonine protein kinase
MSEVDFVLIKQIGKGSFSRVFLCKKVFGHGDDVDVSEHVESVCEELFFIIKEINVNTLVKRHLSKHFATVEPETTGHNGVFDNVTPYTQARSALNNKNSEYDYYHHRFRGLIDSEVRILQTLDHPNIIGFYHYTTTEDGVYRLHMEYCNEGDVYEILKRGVAPQGTRNTMGGVGGEFLYEFMSQVSYGLQYLHEQNIIHRDIKLHNVLLRTNTTGSVCNTDIAGSLEFKISDFGFACYNLKANPDYFNHPLGEKYFKLCGSPYYMAPEIIKNINLLENFTEYKKHHPSRIMAVDLPLFYDAKFDMYSFGMCLYELIFNQLPLPKIKDIGDLERFYKNSGCQQTIDQRIFRSKHMGTTLQELIAKLLRIDHVFRSSADDVVQFVEHNHDALKNECLGVGSGMGNDSFDNSYVSQAELKQHVVNQRIDTGTGGDGGGERSSWHYINNSNSLIRNIDAERGFLDWLLKNTKGT